MSQKYTRFKPVYSIAQQRTITKNYSKSTRTGVKGEQQLAVQFSGHCFNRNIQVHRYGEFGLNDCTQKQALLLAQVFKKSYTGLIALWPNNTKSGIHISLRGEVLNAHYIWRFESWPSSLAYSPFMRQTVSPTCGRGGRTQSPVVRQGLGTLWESYCTTSVPLFMVTGGKTWKNDT